MPEAADVRLTIYNPLGQELRILVSAPEAAGRHDVHWNGRDESGREVTSGVYIYRLEAGDLSMVRKLALIK